MFAKESLCSVNLPIMILSELFDCRTLNECEVLFSFIDHNVYIWKEEFFFKNVKNHLLRTCNDLLRRLSRNQNTVFCGRILIFLANFFPLFERSGLNLTSEFNQDNSTSYALQEDADFAQSADQINLDDSDKKDDFKVDYNFYRKFWQLQEYFRNPNTCYSKSNFRHLQAYCKEVLLVFTGYKIDPNSCFYFQTLGFDNNNKEDKDIFFVKYLTNQKLLELQLSDSNFRRHILIQILILFQYFTTSVKFRVESAVLNEDQTAWINETKKKVFQLIEETPPNGKEVSQVIGHLLSREEFWNNWKNEGCTELSGNADPEADAKRAAEYIQSTYTTHNKRTRIGEYVKSANNSNRILIGNLEMNRLWNFCPDNLEACRSQKRVFTPTIERYFESILQAAPEDRKLYCSDSNFCWKALRLLSEKSAYFFVPNNQVVRPVSDYLEGVIERLAKDYDSVVPIEQSNNSSPTEEETKAAGDTEDISDDELLKNVDSSSVKSTEEDTLDAADTTDSAESALPDGDTVTPSIIDQVAPKIRDYWDELSPHFGFRVFTHCSLTVSLY